MEKLTYEEIVSEIENKRRFGNLAGAEITGQMLARLSAPQTGMRFIHIAGTNGKGSVAAFLCSILRESGLKTGMFTSPHLVDFRERIRINGEMIPKADVRRLGGRLLEQEFGVCPTMFDYCLVMAVLYFKEKNCDVAVIETGLGGRLDSTNALGVPAVSVITKIGYDHMAILGDTLEAIAAEKAGIIKKGTRLVLESQDEAVLRVLCDAAKNAEVEFCEIVDPEEIEQEGHGAAEQRFSFRDYRNLEMKMLGLHQYENAAAAILAAEAFFERGCAGTIGKAGQKRSICAGIYNTFWPGRMEILRKEPFLMVDGAHNSNGVHALGESLSRLFPGEKFHFIMGVMADKDYGKMVEELLPLAVDFCTVTVESNRTLQAEELAQCIREMGIPAESCPDFRECLLPEKCDSVNKTVAFGSLYFIGGIEALMNDKKLQNRYKFV